MSSQGALLRLALVAARAAAAEGAVERKVDVLLAVHAHQERGHVHDLLAHPAPQRPRSPRFYSDLSTVRFMCYVKTLAFCCSRYY